MKTEQLKIIDDTYLFIVWAVPKINKFPRDHKFALGDEMVRGLYRILQNLLEARYSKVKKDILLKSNIALECQRYFFRLAFDFQLINGKSYEFACRSLNEIGRELGGWIKRCGQ